MGAVSWLFFGSAVVLLCILLIYVGAPYAFFSIKSTNLSKKKKKKKPETKLEKVE